MIAISTTWNYSQNCDLRQMFSAIDRLGVNAVELGYNFTSDRLKETTVLLSDLKIGVTSVHNFCPLPEQNIFHRFFTNYYFLSSLVESERECAVKHTKKTIDTAALLAAKIVIIHAGAIEMDTVCIKNLINLYNQGKINSPEAIGLRDDILKLRESQKEPYLNSVIKSLEEITQYAKEKGVKIGLENRYYPNEIPNNEEAGIFLEKFNKNGLVYWHDTGHAVAQERLGIIKENSLLENFSSYLFGFHLHGIKGLKDHLSPLGGDYDFSRLSEYLKRNDLLKVIESHQPASLDELRQAISHFRAQGWV